MTTLFLVLTGLSAVVLIFVPSYLSKRFRFEWKMPCGVFFRAGLALLSIEFFHFSVLNQALDMWPGFFDLPLALQALVIGVSAGLFFELGRFFILDKIFKKTRSFREAVYFALGWNGVETFLYGLLLIVSVVGMSMLFQTSDISSLYPNAAPEQIQQLTELKNSTLSIATGQPYLGLSPILERGALLIMDIALTLIILFGFTLGTTSYAWYSVLFRSIFIGFLYFSSSFNALWSDAVNLVFAGIAYAVIRKITLSYPHAVPKEQ